MSKRQRLDTVEQAIKAIESLRLKGPAIYATDNLPPPLLKSSAKASGQGGALSARKMRTPRPPPPTCLPDLTTIS
jgi:hypothetical protein